MAVKRITNSSIKSDANQSLVGLRILFRNRAQPLFSKTQTTINSGSEKSQKTDDSQSTYSTTTPTTRRPIPKTKLPRGELDESNVSHLFAFIFICSAILFCLVGIDPQQDLHLEQMDINSTFLSNEYIES